VVICEAVAPAWTSQLLRACSSSIRPKDVPGRSALRVHGAAHAAQMIEKAGVIATGE
jgi:hypothetical protein